MKTDFLIIGGGIAGASIAYHLADLHAVIVLEAESQPGYHTTGRSAAFYAESYGGSAIRSLTSASKEFLLDPPRDFAAQPILTKRGALHIFTEAEEKQALKTAADAQKAHIPVTVITREDAISMQPLLQQADFKGALFDQDCGDLDVASLHQAYLSGLKKRGGQIVTSCSLQTAHYDLGRQNKGQQNLGQWSIQTNTGPITARVIVNTAGAWADEVAEKSGVKPLGVQPLRRTVLTTHVKNDTENPPPNTPLTLRYNESLYFKPESGQTLICPEDETPSPPCDAQPELEDIALALHRFEQFTGYQPARPTATWAGLRTFAKDRAPIIGFDDQCPGFFWNIGQGGYGIQTCPAWSLVAATLATGQDIPENLKQFGCRARDYAPARLKP